jgi:hypothetical protein
MKFYPAVGLSGVFLSQKTGFENFCVGKFA